MPLVPHASSSELAVAMREAVGSAVSMRLFVYRFVKPTYANKRDAISGEGAKKFGQRFNPIGLAAIYASIDPEVALREALARNRKDGIPLHLSTPLTMLAFEASLGSVLDLRVNALRTTLGVTAEQLCASGWEKEARGGNEPLTQAIGRIAAAAGVEAIAFHSAEVSGQSNLVVFPAVLRPESFCSIVNEKELQ